jgi:hypothetical protein
MAVGEKLLGQMKPLSSEDVYGDNGSMEVQKRPGSVGMESLQSDPAMIKYAEKTLPDLIKEERAEWAEKHPGQEFQLSRHATSLTTTLATQGEASEPEDQALQAVIKHRIGDVHNNDYLRQNCYAFAVEGADMSKANPIGLGAVPGNVNMGMSAFDGKVDKNTIAERVIQDGAIDAGSDPSKLDIPKGHRLIALYTNDGDYHFNRIDVSADGTKIAMTGKNGFAGAGEEDGGVLRREYDAKDAFDPDAKKNVMNYSGSYEFARFFYVPQEGLNVGMDANLIKNGKMEPKAEGESIEDYGKRVDVAYLEAATGGGGEPAQENAAQLAAAAPAQEQSGPPPQPPQTNDPIQVAAAPKENTPLDPEKLNVAMTGVTPMNDSFSGQVSDAKLAGVMKDYSDAGPKTGPDQDIQNRQNFAMNAKQPDMNMGMS